MDYSTKGFKRTALDSLSGHWALAVIATLVANILGAGGGSGGSGSSGGGASSSVDNSFGSDIITNDISQSLDAIQSLLPLIIGFVAVVFIFILIIALIGPAMELGLINFNLTMIRKTPGEIVKFSLIFSRFDRFWRAFGLRFMMGLFATLWALLFILPAAIIVIALPRSELALLALLLSFAGGAAAVIALYRYALAPYLMADNKNIGVFEAINESKRLMNGRKKKLFILWLSFIGWFFLVIITLGLAGLWISPYINAANAAFYLRVIEDDRGVGAVSTDGVITGTAHEIVSSQMGNSNDNSSAQSFSYTMNEGVQNTDTQDGEQDTERREN